MRNYMSFAVVALTLTAFLALGACTQKRLEDMTASEVAQNPAAYGFVKGGTSHLVPVNGSNMEPSRYDQWTKKTPDGKMYILTIHYDKNGKMVNAKWGGF